MIFLPVPHFESQIQTLWEDEEGYNLGMYTG